jgi:hypothetical protein
MKHFIILFLILSLNCFSQDNEEYKVDEYVSLKLPAGYSIKDTLGIKRIMAIMDGGKIVVSKTIQEQSDADVYDEAQLKKYYVGFQEGFRRSCQGKLISEELVEFDNITASKSTFSISSNGQTTMVDNYGIYLKDHVYSISIVQSNASDANFEAEKQKFLSSIKFAKGLTIEDQFNSNVENTAAYKLGEIFGIFIFFALVVLIVFFIIKKSKGAF